MIVLIALWLAVGSFSPLVRAGNPAEAWDPCALLSDAEVRAAQGRAPIEKVRSEQQSGSFRLVQCFYRTADSTSSVSLALAVPSDNAQPGPREYWRQRFHDQPAAAPGRKKKEPPEPLAGLGEEAFWVGDPVAGALYVLEGPVFVRVSPGGSSEGNLKRERARALAGHVLERLRHVPADDPRRAVPPE